MKLELINPHVSKILISVRKEDSIRALSRRISLSYGWTYKWVQDLAELGVFNLTRMKIFLNEKNKFYQQTLKYIKEVLSNNIQFHYNVLALFGIKYAFIKTDAVFVWTQGGYNIARYRDFYPIFIKVIKKDKKIFENYCKKLNLSLNKKKKIFFNVIYSEDFNFEYCNDVPVNSLNDTIDFMKKNKYNFEPALEMIKEMYKKKIKIKYRESVTNV
ncbi:hypothetical protein HYV49_03820 [Candidatus Pacearchaeota archaeon]|nr:hypothetical protein [Candidatus Pacearchaeota archaeon]